VTHRYLFGPIPAEYAQRNLAGPRRRGECLGFDLSGGADLTIAPSATWEDVCAQLPEGWRPDFVALDLHYRHVPQCLWSAPVPLVALAADWNLLWHYYRLRLPRCERVLTDTAGVEALARAGINHARVANLFGLDAAFLEGEAPDARRDIDILFVGNFQPAVQRQRLPWLARFAALGGRWNVALRTGVFGADYRALLARARVVFNHSIRGEANMRAFEAAASGALLFQEAGNRELPDYFLHRYEAVFYTDDSLEDLLEHYLSHEEERRALAEAARQRVTDFTFEKLWEKAVTQIETDWDVLQQRRQQRGESDRREALLCRSWQALCSSRGVDKTLVADLQAAVAESSQDAALHNALGLAVTLQARGTGPTTALLACRAIAHFRLAWAADPGHALAGLNLVEALVGAEQDAEARQVAEELLARLGQQDDLSPAAFEGGHFPPAFDHFRVEWEAAAWQHAGDPQGEARAKRVLLRWRLHGLLAELTGDLEHSQQAAALRPDLPVSQALLGCALGRGGRSAAAVGPLRQAVQGNPFDLAAARALCQALTDAGDEEGRQLLMRQRHLLARAAPQLVPAEPWFAAPHLRVLGLDEFRRRFGNPDTTRALARFAPPLDTHLVLTLLLHARPRRILEVGTAGHMTANLAEWSPDDAAVFTLGTVAELHPSVGPQGAENPPRADFGRLAGRFGRADKVFFITADSLSYDFGRLGELDFVFIDGGHALEHVLSDTRNAYRQLRPGGCLVWHDVGSPHPWVQVDQALAQAGLPEPICHVSGSGIAFLHKQSAPQAEFPEPTASIMAGEESAVQRVTAEPLVLAWVGEQAALHSLALVNRELCLRLARRGHDLTLLSPDSPQDPGVPQMPLPELLAGRLHRPPERPAEVTVQHTWPPRFEPPPGHWVLMQPWEFGSLPRDWVGPITELVDEVWAYTHHVRETYVQSGIPSERVHIVPLGVDTQRFFPAANPLPLKTARRFRFLFVGGTIWRKGIDLLLAAYGKAFTATDDVCLVVKDMGNGTFYRGQTAETLLARFREQPGAPEVEYLDGALSDDEMASLYAACDCLVQPSRGEGFGLPVAEAMACGLPVVVPDAGATLDFCAGDRAYLVPSRVVFFPENRVGKWVTAGRPWVLEPDLAALVATLRHIFSHPDEALAKGHAARAFVQEHLTWEHAADTVERRLRALRRRPVRRFQKSASAPVPAPAAQVATCRPRVSLCLIVKNEEANLPTCLESAAGLADELIVVDTGSTDRTKEVAARFGARVFDFVWVDSFSAARNECLRHATGEWIFWLDADERLDAENRQKVQALFAELPAENVCYVMKCLCLPDPISKTATVVDHVRLFRNHPQIRWEHRVHEQILPGVRRSGGQVRWSDVVIHHTGYQDPALRRKKLERDLRLLKLEEAEQSEHPFTLFNLGSVYQELGRTADAVAAFRHSLAGSQPQDSIVRKLYALLAQCHRQQGQVQEALTACQQGRGHYPDDVELLFQEALARRELGDKPGAKACWLRLLHRREKAEHFASIDVGLRGYKARHNLAVLCQEEGEHAEAEMHWQAALAEQPDFAPALLGLGEGYLTQQRWTDLEQLASQLRERGLVVEGEVLEARELLARKQFQAARLLLEGVTARHPDAVYPWVILSHVLLQEGKDWGGAEHALRQIIHRDPQHREAWHNLKTLLQQRGRPRAG
jgi:glycosyltransferase involved in cell wall biosynthesis/tetratricopeptide (TPR) repeat protein/predicted O-methyltransferase YrrM